MPTDSLLLSVEAPDGLPRETLICHSAGTPGPSSSMTPHCTCSDRAPPTSVKPLVFCMFCDETFEHQDELGPHVLARHPTTFLEPTVVSVEAEFRIPGERRCPSPAVPAVDEEVVHSCIICRQVSQDAAELEHHMRKHKDYFYYCCSICGRRFREPWFLKAHMKMHTKSGGKGKGLQDSDPPATINDVVLGSAEPVATVYKMCLVCGFFFPDHDSLAEHSEVHNRDDPDGERVTTGAGEEVRKEMFIQGLNLLPSSRAPHSTMQPVRISKWIPQLDPFNTYQAWQVATKGKVAFGVKNAKSPLQEASTDNDDCASDKEELSGVYVDGRAAEEVEPQTPIAPAPLPRRRSLIQKNVHKSEERPTTCEDCQKTFRTYHQLVLHSRVHKRDRLGEESPAVAVESKLPRGGSLEQGELEEGQEEAALAAEEDGLERVKGRSKGCSYCGKSFRSSYYLTIHLRTHTGEKPYKCSHCDYAAAQKTSLKYHLERRHKDKTHLKLPPRPASPPALVLKLEPTGEDPSSLTRMRIDEGGPRPEAEPHPTFADRKPLPHADAVQVPKTTQTFSTDNLPLNLKMEKYDLEEGPLNPSVKVSRSVPAGPNVLVRFCCTQCPFASVSPEVLSIHSKLTHYDKAKGFRRPPFSALKRHTSCPPALNGKDVPKLPMILRSHPRRTRSPPGPAPSRQQEKTAAGAGADSAPAAVKRSPLPAEEKRKGWHHVEPNLANQEPARLMESRLGPGGQYLLDLPAPPDRIGIGAMSYPVRSSVLWSTDSARMSLSGQFGTPSHLDLGESLNKRLKYDSEAGERAGFRSANRVGPGRAMLPTRMQSLQTPLPAVPAALVNGSSVSLRGPLVGNWGPMSLLQSCTTWPPCHTPPGNPQRTGAQTVLFQHLPSLPNLTRREAPGGSPYPNQRHGPARKSS